MAHYRDLGWNCVLSEFGGHYVFGLCFFFSVEKFYALAILILCMFTVLFSLGTFRTFLFSSSGDFMVYFHVDLCPSIMLGTWWTFSLGYSLESFLWWFLLHFLIFSLVFVVVCLFPFQMEFLLFRYGMVLSVLYFSFLTVYPFLVFSAEHSVRIN